jgi:hypothetical protein
MGTAADFDIVTVAADIAPSEITVQYVPSTQQFFNDGGFFLRINGTTDAFKLIWSPTTGPEIEIEQVIFADGTIWDETILAAMAIQNGSAPTLAASIVDQNATEDARIPSPTPTSRSATRSATARVSLTVRRCRRGSRSMRTPAPSAARRRTATSALSRCG